MTSSWIGQSGGVIASRGMAIGLTLASSVLLARMLGPVGYGYYALALGLTSLFTAPFQPIFRVLATREIAASSDCESRHRFCAAQRASLRLAMFLGISFVIFGALCLWIPTSSAPLVSPMVLAAGFGMAAAALVLASVLGVLTGTGRVVAAQYLESVYRPALFVGCLLLVALILARPISVSDVVLVQVASGVAIAGYGILALYRGKDLCQRLAGSGMVGTKEWLHSAVLLGTGGIFLVLQQRLGVFLLGLVGSPDQVGLFQLALRTSEVLTVTHAAIGLVIAPKISQLHAKSHTPELETMVFQGALLSFVIGLVMYAAILWQAENILALIYGDNYLGAADLLRVLGFGAVISMSAGFPAVVLNMIGFEGDALRGIAFGAIVNLILGAFLVYLFGPIGVAISGAAGMVVVNVVLVGLVRKRAGIRVAVWQFSG